MPMKMDAIRSPQRTQRTLREYKIRTFLLFSYLCSLCPLWLNSSDANDVDISLSRELDFRTARRATTGRRRQALAGSALLRCRRFGLGKSRRDRGGDRFAPCRADRFRSLAPRR